MAPSSPSTLLADYPALLAWFNHLPPFARNDDFTEEDLSDGTRIWEALHNIVPVFFEGELPDGMSLSRRRASHVGNLQNIKRICKALRHYLGEECGTRMPEGFDGCDLNLVAEGTSKADLATILKTLLCVAVLHPSETGNEMFLYAISQLPASHQGTLARIINELQEAEEANQHEQPGDRSLASSPHQPLGSDMRDEERVFQLMSERKELERERNILRRELEDHEERLIRLQENNAILQEQLKQAQTSLESATDGADQGYRLRELETKNKGLDDYISELEERLHESHDKETTLQTDINKLRKANEKLQPLQDEIDELKAGRDTLVRRANALERYKHKVQTVQELENENRVLRRELEDQRWQASADGGGSTPSDAALQREVMELKSLVANTEIQLVEAINRRKQIEYDNDELIERLEEARAQRERDQEAMMRMREGSPGPTMEADSQLLDLDAELESSDQATLQRLLSKTAVEWLPMTHYRQKEAVQARASRKTTEDAAQIMALQKRLETERGTNSELQRRNQQLLTTNVSYESMMKDVEAVEQYVKSYKVDGVTDKYASQKAFMDMQERVQKSATEQEALRKQLDVLQAQNGDAEKTSMNALLQTRTYADSLSVATYDQEKVEALEILKELNARECVELRAKIISQEEVFAEMKLQLEECRGALMEALRQAPNPTAVPLAAAELSPAQPTPVVEDVKPAHKDEEEDATAPAPSHVANGDEIAALTERVKNIQDVSYSMLECGHRVHVPRNPPLDLYSSDFHLRKIFNVAFSRQSYLLTLRDLGSGTTRQDSRRTQSRVKSQR